MIKSGTGYYWTRERERKVELPERAKTNTKVYRSKITENREEL